MAAVMGSLLVESKSEPVLIYAWRHSCSRCNHVWTSEQKDPTACAGCRDPNWRKPRRWLKPSKPENKVRIESRLDLDSRQPKPPVISKEATDEARRDLVIKAMYPYDARKGYLPCFSKEACPSLYMYNNAYNG